tara:strand:+ start:2713 stop:3036 length:324 start_codon:yes stop_codon:yes gene_type:complete
MTIKFKYIFYLSMFSAIVFLAINWHFLSDMYEYNIYKEKCIITKINKTSSISRIRAKKFCDCKIENFKKEKINIFVSKLRVEEQFLEKEKFIDKQCTKNLKAQTAVK